MEITKVGSQYSRRTLVGNWFEDQTLAEQAMQAYVEQKAEREREAALAAVSKVAVVAGQVGAEGRVKLSASADGYVRFGDFVMFASICTTGLLTVAEFGDGVVTSSANDVPLATNTFVIEPVSDKSARPGDVLRYGQAFQLRLHPAALDGKRGYERSEEKRPTYLASVPVSLLTTLKNKYQQAFLTTERSSDANWRIVLRDIDRRLAEEGGNVGADEEILVVHQPTGHALASDKAGRRGKEAPVVVHTYQGLGKKMGLLREAMGTSFPDVPSKPELEQNGWTILMG